MCVLLISATKLVTLSGGGGLGVDVKRPAIESGVRCHGAASAVKGSSFSELVGTEDARCWIMECLFGLVYSSECGLKGINLPQIKTLILPPAAHPLLQHCRDVENIICMVDGTVPYKEFHRSLPSGRRSKVKRLAIPLVFWDNPTRR